MYEVKNRIFLELSKTQKSALCNYLRLMVKNFLNLSENEILNKFLEDEKYYLKMNSSRFEFLSDIIDDEKFVNDVLLYVKECHKYYDFKKSQAPLIQAQKEFNRQKTIFLREQKMSKQAPTKKQIFYYKSLCKRYNEEQRDIEALSRLEIRNEIDRILNEHQTS